MNNLKIFDNITSTITFIIQIVIMLGVIIYTFYRLKNRYKPKRLIAFCILEFVFTLLLFFFDLKVLFCFGICFTACLAFLTTSNFKEANLNKKQREKNEVTIEEKNSLVDVLVTSAEYFSKRKIGAIITIEQNDELNTFINKAIKIDGIATTELLKTIFFPNTALHDGAVIIRGNHIACAAAYFPLTDKTDVPTNLGTRHRAALGITEETDAVCITVSEETGAIGFCTDGTISQNISLETLKELLTNL